MIILHYIPDMALNTGIVPEYVKILVRSTEQVATSYIVTSKDLGKELLTFRRDIIHQLEMFNPDIVHVHAAWDFRSAMVEKLARNRGYFTVVSPHGGLAPEIMDVHFWKERLPRIFLYQLWMIRRCKAVIASSEKESDELKKLRWNSKIILVPHPLTNQMSDEETSTLLLSAYRKVIDTNYRSRLTVEEEELLCQCIKTAVVSEMKPSGAEAFDYAADKPDLTVADISYRRLFLYAYDELVLDEYMKGASLLEVKMPPCPDVELIPRFRVKKKKDSVSVRCYRKLQNILMQLIPEENVATAFLKQSVEHINLRSLVYAYAAIRCCDFDEDKFEKLVRSKNIKHYTKNLLRQLSDLFQLESAFMPMKI